ncbi:hypothetical protein GJ496_004325 [Pomphorhynchus laevis]|nr:hypothetical protein GJ496_004325 [Pomphorhynchus laevis]
MAEYFMSIFEKLMACPSGERYEDQKSMFDRQCEDCYGQPLAECNVDIIGDINPDSMPESELCKSVLQKCFQREHLIKFGADTFLVTLKSENSPPLVKDLLLELAQISTSDPDEILLFSGVQRIDTHSELTFEELAIPNHSTLCMHLSENCDINKQ